MSPPGLGFARLRPSLPRLYRTLHNSPRYAPRTAPPPPPPPPPRTHFQTPEPDLPPWKHVLRFLLQGAKYFLLFHLTTEYLFSIERTEGISMVPTISARGNWCYVNHLFRRGRGVKVGDVVVFTHPMVAGAKAAKRVIGLEGDFVCVVTGPSEAEDEDKDLKAQRAQFTTEMVQVPKGHCWVEGDNLEWSRDSRVYGPVPMALIRGKVEMRLWPLSEVGSIRNAVTERVEEEKEVRIVN